MAKRKKQMSYLDALSDPALDEWRVRALRFMTKATLIRTFEADPVPSTVPVEEEAAKNSLRCVGCGAQLRQHRPFCDDYPCREIARTIRYVRSTESDGRIELPDVQEAIGVKLAQLTAGGYPARERRLAKARRQQILERDEYRCQLCQKPATEVDHIRGDSSDSSNLRALCGDCNKAEALKNMRPATDEKSEWLQEMFYDVAVRVAAPSPTRLCDDPERWKKSWSGVTAARRRLVRERQEVEDDDEFEDVDGYLYHSMQKDD